jgi:RNA polymerase sigma factor (sigma-70 family)
MDRSADEPDGMAMVRWTVAHHFRRAQQNGFDYDALVSAGWEGLMRAHKRYEEVKPDCPFKRIAFFYIRRAILNYLRWENGQYRVNVPKWVGLEEACDEPCVVHWKPEHIDLQLGLAILDEREKEAVIEHGMWDRPQLELATRWGVHESRVGQIYQGALKKLRIHFGVTT